MILVALRQFLRWYAVTPQPPDEPFLEFVVHGIGSVERPSAIENKMDAVPATIRVRGDQAQLFQPCEHPMAHAHPEPPDVRLPPSLPVCQLTGMRLGDFEALPLVAPLPRKSPDGDTAWAG